MSDGRIVTKFRWMEIDPRIGLCEGNTSDWSDAWMRNEFDTEDEALTAFDKSNRWAELVLVRIVRRVVA